MQYSQGRFHALLPCSSGRRELISHPRDLFRPEVYKNPEIRIFSLILRDTRLFILKWTCRHLPGKDDLSALHWD